MKIWRHKYRFSALLTFLLWVATLAAQQTGLDAVPPLALDTLPPGAASATAAPADSAVVDLANIKISSDGLSDVVDYTARDSMWFDVTNKQVHLYGVGSSVKYTTLEIKAGYILLDYGKNEVTASMFPDSSGKMAGPPDFKDGEQNFTANKLRYNFKTKKGIIYEARTKQEDLYVLGQKAKFLGPPEGDTLTKPTIYNQDAILTTCDAEHPHFGIRTKKLKVIPNKLVVTGLSNLEIAGIPTPFVLPFGFYPITQTRKAGLIIPQDFNFAEQEGLGLQNFGWYQPINEHIDATVLFNAFVSGSWGVTASTRYSHKYHNAGNVEVRFNRRVRENAKAEKESFKSFGLRISHNQDSKAHPTRQFGGSVNIETNRDQNRNRNDYQSVYQNTLSSNLRYSKSFPGRPYQFNAGFTHSQNTQTRKMNITLPEVTFTMQRIFPFKRKNPIGNERWYEKVSLTYNSQLRNALQDVPDTTLFSKETLRNIKSGIQHRASTDFNFKVLKYINVSPNANFESNWYPYTINYEFDPTVRAEYDTIRENNQIVEYRLDSTATEWGRDTLIRNYGFNMYNNFNAGVSASTVLFATKQWKSGWLRGIRHKITPSVSIGFGPDYSRNTRIFREIETTSQPGRSSKRKYSIYDEGIYSKPSNSSRSMILNYSLLNVLEMKHFSKRDTTGKGKKVKIFDNLNFSGSYNFSADTLRWSQVGTNGVFRLFKGITTLNWNLSFDPYILNEKGVRVDRFSVRETGRLLRTDRIGLQMNTALTVNQLREMFSKNKDGDDSGKSQSGAGRPVGGPAPDDLLGWFDRFSVTHYIGFQRRNVIGSNRDTIVLVGHNLGIRGDIPLSAKWTLNISNISYDFQAKQLVYPDLGISRDLHCWEMRISWQPTRGTYNFYIAAKPGTFQFLKAPYRKNNFDASGSF